MTTRVDDMYQQRSSAAEQNDERSVFEEMKLAFPLIVYGTAWKKEKTKALVLTALQTGFRAIDTASQLKHYSESLVGEAIQESKIPRQELFIQSKFTSIDGHDTKQPLPYDPAAPLADQVSQSFETAKKNLKTDYLDAFLMHSPMNTFSETLEVWRAFEKLHKAGGVKMLGMSNMYDLKDLKQLWKEAEVKPTILQNRFQKKTDYDKTLRAFCNEHGIVYESFWTLTANPDLLKSAAVQKAANNTGRSAAVVLFSYLIHTEHVTPLTGTSSKEHMQDDLAAVDLRLSDEDTAAIMHLFES